MSTPRGFRGGEAAFSGWRTPVLTQYWRAFDDLHTYARDAAREQLPAWRAFNKAVGGDGTVGIFYETYIAAAGGHETLYAHMPPFGLGRVAGSRPATGNRKDARRRLKEGTLE